VKSVFALIAARVWNWPLAAASAFKVSSRAYIDRDARHDPKRTRGSVTAAAAFGSKVDTISIVWRGSRVRSLMGPFDFLKLALPGF
jgi:hypothetical protein